jgi:MoxR-like ATPase
MEEQNAGLVEKVQALSDIELAVLLCLVTDQHCIVEADPLLLPAVEQELQIVASQVFGLTSAVLSCAEETTLDEFGNGILAKEDGQDYFHAKDTKSRDDRFSSYSESSRFSDRRTPKPAQFSSIDSRRIANVVIATNINEANHQVQIQALELIRNKRNYTRTAVHPAPRPFLFIALNAVGSTRLTTHLNDQFFISHTHQAYDGFPNLEQDQFNEEVSDDNASTSSVIKSPRLLSEKRKFSLHFSQDEVSILASQTSEVQISSEVRGYVQNIVVFLRLHRAVGGGISALATRHLTVLVQALAPLHGLSYVSPSLVALAARKIYPHRIVITSPENERSMQWGSSLEAVRAVLEGVTPEDVIEEVLQSVEAPL